MKKSCFFKITLSFILFASTLSYANGQFVTTSKKDKKSQTKTSSTKVKSQYESSSTNSEEQGSCVFAIGFGFHPEHNNFGADIGGELGYLFNSTNLFFTIGGRYSTWSTTTGPKNMKIDTETESVLIPLNVGWLFGNKEKFHATLSGGVFCDYLISLKINKEKVKVPDSDKISWNGSGRFSLGYNDVNFYAQYYIPFDSDKTGVLMIGFVAGL